MAAKLDTAAKAILKAISAQSQLAFDGIVDDFSKDVLPTMASIAHDIALIGLRLADGTYTKDIADVEVEAQVNAAASVIVRFANVILKKVEDIINALITAVKAAINAAVGVALIV